MNRIALLLACTLLLTCGEARAASTGNVRVVVFDTETGAAIRDAQVQLSTPDENVIAYSDTAGAVQFNDVPSGIYRARVSHDGYEASQAVEFEVLEARSVRVEIGMYKLKTIANVRTRPIVLVSSSVISANSPERRISSSLLDALSKSTDVSIDDSVFGTAYANGISLHGQGSINTGYAINGGSVGGGATNVNIAQDLFTGATVSFTPALGSLSGLVRYNTLRPTKSVQYKASASAGTYASYYGSGSVTGSSGHLGFALQHVLRGMDAFANGSVFEDQSGLTYPHLGNVQRFGDSASLAYSIGNRASVNFTIIKANDQTRQICTLLLSLLPCGNGPDDVTHSSYRATILEATAFIGQVQGAFFALNDVSTNDLDERQRLYHGGPAPYLDTSEVSDRNVATTWYVTKGAHTVKLDYRAFFSTGTYRHDSSVSIFESENNEVGHTTTLSDSIRMGKHLSVSPGFAMTTSSTIGSGNSWQLDANWDVNAQDTASMSVAFAKALPQFVLSRNISDPSTAQFDCYNGSTAVLGPADAPTMQTARSVNLSLLHKFANSYVRLQLGDQVGEGQQRILYLPLAAALDPLAASAYISRLQGFWENPQVCGDRNFDPSKVFVQQYVSGLSQHLSYATLNGRFALGKRVIILPSISYNHVYLTELDPRLRVDGSFYRAGSQLPSVPYFSGSLTIDAISGKDTEWIANIQHTSVNNQNNLPGYTTVNLGASLSVAHGKLIIAASNVFGAGSGLFTTYQGINPLSVVGGGNISFPTTPLPPRQLTFTFETSLGSNK